MVFRSKLLWCAAAVVLPVVLTGTSVMAQQRPEVARHVQAQKGQGEESGKGRVISTWL